MTKPFNDARRLVIGATVCLLISACDGTGTSSSPNNSDKITRSPSTERTAPSKGIDAEAPLNIVVQQRFARAYQAALNSGFKLAEATQTFLQAPSIENLEKAQLSWRHCHDNYLLAQASRALAIPHPTFNSALTADEDDIKHSLYIRLDQYPAIPGYLDAVTGYPQSGLIYSEIPLDFDTLNREHQFSDTAYVAMGFHALEIMLFGGGTDPSTRHLDFSKDAKQNIVKRTERRRAFTHLLTQQIKNELALLNREWGTPDGYYQNFMRLVEEDTLRTVLQDALVTEKRIQNESLGHLSSEIGAQRLQLLQELTAHTPDRSGQL